MNRARSSAGFTLIELLVAITLASLVAVLGAVVLRAALDFNGRAQRHLRETEDLLAADRLLAREWSRRREQTLVATANRLEFQTDRLYDLSRAGEEGATRVGYVCSENDTGQIALERRLLARVEPDRRGSGSSRVGSEGPDATAAGWQVLRTEVLLPRLVACSFAYLQTRQSSDARIAEWRGEVGAGQPAPRLVRLRLATQRGEIAPLVHGVYAVFGAEG